MDDFAGDLAAISQMDAVPKILEVLCRVTGLGFSAVARVTEDRWIACAVRDEIEFGLRPGGELRVGTTICDEIRRSHQLVVIDHVDEDVQFRGHPTPKMYGFQSYISVPIMLRDGRMFGTLCAIDPRPARLNTPETIGMFTLFAELIAFHLQARDRVAELEDQVAHRTTALRDTNAELHRQMTASNSDREALRGFAGRLERVREEERTAISRELHDECGQALTAIRIDLKEMRQALRHLPDGVVDKALARVASMDDVVESAFDGLDRIVCELRPAVLDSLGCAAAAEWLVAQFRKRTGLCVRFERDADLEVPEPAGTAIFRVLQEALTNVARHAHARSVDVRLTMTDGDVILSVADDGRGITEAERSKSTAFGLRGMSERMLALHGSMTLTGSPDGGTRLEIRAPASTLAAPQAVSPG